jgi:hypothetical protein
MAMCSIFADFSGLGWEYGRGIKLTRASPCAAAATRDNKTASGEFTHRVGGIAECLRLRTWRNYVRLWCCVYEPHTAHD